MDTQQAAVEIATIVMAAILNMFGLWVIAWYRVHKPGGNRQKVTSIREFLGKYWVEAIITVVVVPQWPDVIKSAFKLLGGV